MDLNNSTLDRLVAPLQRARQGAANLKFLIANPDDTVYKQISNLKAEFLSYAS